MSAASPDLPEPEWWAEAKALAAQGFSAYKIGMSLGRDQRSVAYVIDPEYRARHKAKQAEWNRKRKLVDRPPYKRDKGREYARQNARARWRAEGRVRSLFDYYREDKCL